MPTLTTEASGTSKRNVTLSQRSEMNVDGLSDRLRHWQLIYLWFKNDYTEVLHTPSSTRPPVMDIRSMQHTWMQTVAEASLYPRFSPAWNSLLHTGALLCPLAQWCSPPICNKICMIQICSGITRGRVLKGPLYTKILEVNLYFRR